MPATYYVAGVRPPGGTEPFWLAIFFLQHPSMARHQSTPATTEMKLHLFLTVAVPLLTLSMSAAAIAVGAWQFHEGQQLDFKKSFYDERIRAYADVSDAFSKVARMPVPSEAREAAVQRFWELRLGRGVLFQDGDVGDALHRAGRWITHCVERNAQPIDSSICTPTAGNANSLSIAEAMRTSISRTYDIPLKKLDAQSIYLVPGG